MRRQVGFSAGNHNVSRKKVKTKRPNLVQVPYTTVGQRSNCAQRLKQPER
jgi:hypothetical protein